MAVVCDVRVIMQGEQPWFVGKDVASMLGYKNVSDALLQHVDNEDKDKIVKHDSIGRLRKVPIIDESGLYSLILYIA